MREQISIIDKAAGLVPLVRIADAGFDEALKLKGCNMLV